MQPPPTDGAPLRARLNELPSLIEAAIAQGDQSASQRLRTERAHLEEIVPILESEAKTRQRQALLLEVAQCEQNILQAQTALEVATRDSQLASQPGEAQKHPFDEAVAKHHAWARMYAARHALAEQCQELARLRVALRDASLEESEENKAS